MTDRPTALTSTQAARVLGLDPFATWDEIRQAYRDQMRVHHPDRGGDGATPQAARINEAYRTLRLLHRSRTSSGSSTTSDHAATPPPPATPWRRFRAEDQAPGLIRVDRDTLLVAAPPDETFRWLVEAATDLGEITYLDRSGPILEVLCRFEGEPATSLVLTTQGRGGDTEVFCTVESIEARPAPPVSAVIDVFELAFRRRQGPTTPA